MESRITYAIIDKTDPDTGEVTNPVVRRVLKRDGKHSYVSGERIVADSLSDFRRRISARDPVEGAPSTDEVRRLVSEMSPDELSALGLVRSEDGTGVDALTIFASQEARDLAVGNDLDMDDLRDLAGSGSGTGGRLTTADIRGFITDIENAEDGDGDDDE